MASSSWPTGGGGGVARDAATAQYFVHSSGTRISTDAVLAKSLTAQYPGLEVVTVAQMNCDLLGFASAGNADATLIENKEDTLPSYVGSCIYLPPPRRLDGADGALVDSLSLGKFLYKYDGDEFIVYLAKATEGIMSYPATHFYILAPERPRADRLVRAAGAWTNELHDEIWVFDMGAWRKDPGLYRSVQAASWDSVILDSKRKKALIDDHLSFFQSRDIFARLKVPWKRGLIYHGPPGNGKTISIKATMKMLLDLKEPVPSLYVRSLVSMFAPQYALMQIFQKARQIAPCLLIFEDLDSIVNDVVRSYFLNEVDGLQNNDGIFMVGSTNHLELLDPGISKRPSRFDRKYFFPDPDMKERVAYCHFWQSKLKDNKQVEFPDKLCTAIAEITDGFSFAYIQEAFVAALLVIARGSGPSESGRESYETLTEDLGDGWIAMLSLDDHKHEELDKYILWVEVKKQVKTLREGMEGKQRQASAMK